MKKILSLVSILFCLQNYSFAQDQISLKTYTVTISDIITKIIPIDFYREQKIEVNTQDFAAGIYVVQIQTADFMVTKKLVVEK